MLKQNESKCKDKQELIKIEKWRKYYIALRINDREIIKN